MTAQHTHIQAQAQATQINEANQTNKNQSYPSHLPLTAWFTDWLQAHQAFAATLHQVYDQQLYLRMSFQIPEAVLSQIQVISKGVGMAGLAFERAEQISHCPLALDAFQRLRPNAQFVEGKGTIAIPIWQEKEQCFELWGILGMALPSHIAIDMTLSEKIAQECAQLIRQHALI